MARLRPFDSGAAMFEAAERTWWGLDRADWLEAFAAHPRIGDRDATAGEVRRDRRLVGPRAGGRRSAQPEDVLQALADDNARYQERFGYIFIVCATGKTAEEMLALLRERLSERRRHRDPGRRRRAGEDHADPPGEDRPMSPITTHVLDIARGRPAQGVAVTLEIAQGPDEWTELARGVTDGDGRIGQFDPPALPLKPAVYRLRFATGALLRGDRGPRLLSRGLRRPSRSINWPGTTTSRRS